MAFHVGSSYRAAGLTVRAAIPYPCSLAGLPSQGRLFELDSNGSPFTVMTCVARRGDLVSTAACIGFDPRTKPAYPVPCDQVFGATGP